MNWTTCTWCTCRTGIIHYNGESFCSRECLQKHQAAERTIRSEARDRMAAARDRRGQISVAMSCALICLVLAWCLVGGYEQAEAGSQRWQGQKLQSSQGAKLVARSGVAR